MHNCITPIGGRHQFLRRKILVWTNFCRAHVPWCCIPSFKVSWFWWFLEDFNRIWAWWPSWSHDENTGTTFVSYPTEAPHGFNWPLINVWWVWMPDANGRLKDACLYYKLIYKPKARVGYKHIGYPKRHLSEKRCVAWSFPRNQQILSENVLFDKLYFKFHTQRVQCFKCT